MISAALAAEIRRVQPDLVEARTNRGEFVGGYLHDAAVAGVGGEVSVSRFPVQQVGGNASAVGVVVAVVVDTAASGRLPSARRGLPCAPA